MAFLLEITDRNDCRLLVQSMVVEESDFCLSIHFSQIVSSALIWRTCGSYEAKSFRVVQTLESRRESWGAKYGSRSFVILQSTWLTPTPGSVLLAIFVSLSHTKRCAHSLTAPPCTTRPEESAESQFPCLDYEVVDPDSLVSRIGVRF
jgi:hypothetical protein